MQGGPGGKIHSSIRICFQNLKFWKNADVSIFTSGAYVREERFMCQNEKYNAPRRGRSQYFVLEVALIVLLTCIKIYDLIMLKIC